VIVERTDFVSVPVTDLGRSTAWFFTDPDGNELMLHRRYAASD
jgi:hypothetical protein